MARGKQIIAVLAAVAGAAEARAAEQSQLKAAIIYNIVRFARFVPPPAGTVELCVLATDPTAQAIARLDGKIVPDGRLQVRMLSRPGEIRGGCTIAYVGAAISPAEIDGVSMTIGDGPSFAARGGTVGLTSFGRQISFELNPKAGARRGVRFSATLLNLAASVRSR